MEVNFIFSLPGRKRIFIFLESGRKNSPTGRPGRVRQKKALPRPARPGWQKKNPPMAKPGQIWSDLAESGQEINSLQRHILDELNSGGPGGKSGSQKWTSSRSQKAPKPFEFIVFSLNPRPKRGSILAPILGPAFAGLN